MHDLEQKNGCKNCKYYIEHYIIATRTSFNPIDGHCINPAVIGQRKRRQFELRENCEYWENNEIVKTDRKKAIKEVLRSMEKHLSHIERILEFDEE